MLRIEDVSKGFSRGSRWTKVLEDVSFTVDGGEIVAIVGGPLAGKTTLLRIAAGMERCDRGSVSLGGQRLGEQTNRSWWMRLRLPGRRTVWSGRDGPEREILWIDRNGPQLDVEVSKFVGWPLALHGRKRRQAEETAVRALERVGAGECVGRRWRELSNRQRVLVGLARAFAGSPRVVIIDDLLDALENTLGSKDSEATFKLLSSLIEESEPRCGVLLSVSDRESALLADRVFSLTRKGTLKPLSGRSGNNTDGGGEDTNVIPFPNHMNGKGSQDVGS
jgi:ABC-type nitrate/sulfonate/bicarbonate transport system ATPase subunit